MEGLDIRMSKDIALFASISTLQSVNRVVDSVLRNVRLGGDGGIQAIIEAKYKIAEDVGC